VAEDGRLGARLMERTQFGLIEQGSFGRHDSKKIANTGESHGARTVISDELLCGIEEPLQAR
jgi:hypothetical protein